MKKEYESNLAKDNIALRTQIVELKKQIEELKELVGLKNRMLVAYRLGQPSSQAVGQVIDKIIKLEEELKEVLK